MSKTNKIIILLILILLLAGGLFYLWGKYIKPTTPSQTDGDPSDFPFGTGNGKDEPSARSSSSRSGDLTGTEDVDMPILRQISDKPIAGGIAFQKASTTVIRYVERGTGHIVETTADSYNSSKVSNTTIPKVPQAIWSPDGQSVIMRYLKDGEESIYTFSANIAKATTSQDISKNPKSAFLPSKINQLAINPTGDKIFYLRNEGGASAGATTNIDGSQKSQIFNSAVTEWLVSWPNKDILAFVTKPSFLSPGYLFFVNSKTGASNKILSSINGLTVLAGSTTKNILYSETVEESVKLNYYNLKNNQTKKFSFKTLPEKCVWSKTEEFIVYCAVPKSVNNGEYPDDWYQGIISFNDKIWKVDVSSNSSELVFDFQAESGKDFDVVEPFLSADDEYLFFINKKDLSFWSLSLKKQQINKKQSKNPDSF